MTNELTDILNAIAVDYNGKIQPDSNLYHLITMTTVARLLGELELKYQLRDHLRKKYPKFRAIVPIKEINGGTNVKYNGAKFFSNSDYVQLNSGILVPECIAKEAELPSRQYKPGQEIIVNFRF